MWHLHVYKLQQRTLNQNKQTKKDLKVLLSTRFHQQRKVPHLYYSDQDEEQGHSTDLEKPKNTNRHSLEFAIKQTVHSPQ